MSYHQNWRLALWLLLSALFCPSLEAQSFQVRGSVADALDSLGLSFPVLSLSQKTDSSFRLSQEGDAEGLFSFQGLSPGTYSLRIELVGYESQSHEFELGEADIDLGRLFLEPQTHILEGVVVRGRRILLQVRGDTLEYDAEAIALNPNADLEDLLKRLQGIKVSKDGQITAQGRPVTRVTIDGKDFFGQNAQIALKNLPADMVSKVQILEEKTKASKQSGIEDGQLETVLNLVTKNGMNRGVFGNVEGGYAPLEQRYNAELNVHNFGPKHRLSVLGFGNNINRQGFNFSEIMNMNGMGQEGGSQGLGNAWGMGNVVNNFFNTPYQLDGITAAQAGAVNFYTEPSKNFKITGNYIYQGNEHRVERSSEQQYFTSETSLQRYREEANNRQTSQNHNTALAGEWQIDSLSRLNFDANARFKTGDWQNSQSNSSSLNELLLNEGSNYRRGRSQNLSANFGLGFNRRFAKAGRSLNLNASASPWQQTQNRDSLDANNTGLPNIRQISRQDEKQQTWQASLSYNEPLSTKLNLSLNYKYGQGQDLSERRTLAWDEGALAYNRVDSVLSNDFQRQVAEHNTGLNLNYKHKTLYLSAQLNYAHNRLDARRTFPGSDSLQKRFDNLLPGFSLRYNPDKKQRLSFNYNTSVLMPSVSALQDVVDNRNPLIITQGNPDLRQAYTHRVSGFYNYMQPEKGLMINFNFNARHQLHTIERDIIFAERDSLLPSGVLLARGAQLQKQANLPSSSSFSATGSFSRLFPKLMDTEFSLDLDYDYVRRPNRFNGQLNDLYNQDLSLDFGLENGELIEGLYLELYYSPSIGQSRNSLQPQFNQIYYSQELNASIEWEWERLSLSSEISREAYWGRGENFDRSFWIWNADLAYRFLANEQLTLKLSAYDLLNQNNNIRRDVWNGTIQDTRSNVLQRLVILSLSYRFRYIPSGEASDKPKKQKTRRYGDGLIIIG